MTDLPVNILLCFQVQYGALGNTFPMPYGREAKRMVMQRLMFQ